MGVADDIIREVLLNEKELSAVFTRRLIKHRLGMTIEEFSKRSGIPASTLYKILSGRRDPNLRTFRRIINTIRHIEGENERKKFIAVISARGILDEIDRRRVYVDGDFMEIREYAVTTMEEAIIKAIKAEKDGASALVCAPILSPTVEKVVSIPVVTIKPRTSVLRAIDIAVKKVRD
ncbi:MAG: helix-turn-helix domain-containing protein [Canidatus Methanoxibalbensis ujae]|nr:helix-turn-helix domain-containing protein [Candidatus Methanoxibalbensis ujae]RLG37634.1 MAG: transcriptional regulator [Methanosarcinales archaeon]